MSLPNYMRKIIIVYQQHHNFYIILISNEFDRYFSYLHKFYFKSSFRFNAYFSCLLNSI